LFCFIFNLLHLSPLLFSRSGGERIENLFIFPGTQATLAMETVESFWGKAEKLFHLPILKFKVHF